MDIFIPAPAKWIKSIGELRLPPITNQRLQSLMDGNNEGQLTPQETDELVALVELNERLSIIRAQAMKLLDHKLQ